MFLCVYFCCHFVTRQLTSCEDFVCLNKKDTSSIHKFPKQCERWRLRFLTSPLQSQIKYFLIMAAEPCNVKRPVRKKDNLKCVIKERAFKSSWGSQM